MSTEEDIGQSPHPPLVEVRAAGAEPPPDGALPLIAPEKPPLRPPPPNGEPRKKIAILGTTPSRMQAPLDDPEWDIWTIGPGGKDSHGWDMLFEVHHVWPENFKDYLRDLSLVEPPQSVITLEPAEVLISRWAQTHAAGDMAKHQELIDHVNGEWKANKTLDRRLMTEHFMRAMWFSSSISYCIGAAIERKPTDIGFWGIDLESGEEYISQFSGAAHLIDVARHLGINISLPEGCGLDRDIKPYPDRYENNLAMTMEKKHGWLTTSCAQLENEFKLTEANLYRQEGAIMAMESGKAPEDHIAKAKENLTGINQQLAQQGANLNHLKGELSATQYYRRMYVWGVQDPDG